jgi:HEAT repeat protein
MPTTEKQEKKIVQDVRLILRDLHKVFKIISLYPANNPLPQSMRKSVAEKLADLIFAEGEIYIEVEKDRLVFQNEDVFVDKTKEEVLAGLFFQAGITHLVFSTDFIYDEIQKFFDVLKNHINNIHQDSDLPNLLWEAQISGLKIFTIEDINLLEYDGQINIQEFQEGASQRNQEAVESEGYKSIFGLGNLSDDELNSSGSVGLAVGKVNLEGDSATFESGPITIFDESGQTFSGASEAASAMGYEDLKEEISSDDLSPSISEQTSLILQNEFTLTDEDSETIRQLLDEDSSFDMYESTIEILKEMLTQENDLESFKETLIICDRVINQFLEMARIFELTGLLKYLRSVQIHLEKEKPSWSDKIKDVLITVNSQKGLEKLVEVLNRVELEIGVSEFKRYLEQLGLENLNSIVNLLGVLENRQHREALCDFLAANGKNRIDILSKGMFDKRWFVIRNTIIILARTGDPEVINYLNKAVKHDDIRVRRELVKALKEMPNLQALHLLKKMAVDEKPEIRRQAIDAIVSRRGEEAFNVITDLINDEHFDSMQHGEQQQLLTAYSILGGDHAVEFLGELIVRANLFGDKNIAFLRQAAFEALIYNRSERCERLLLKLTKSWRTEIRQQAVEALKNRRRIMYGGSDGNES